jgi:hypothetical protein
MQLSETVNNYLNNPDRINILSTSNKKGETDVAIFGSPQLTEKRNLSLVLQDSSRTYKNLKENPYASCLVLVPGKTGSMMNGCRVYLKVNYTELSRNPVFLREREKGDKTDWEKGLNIEIEKDAEELSHTTKKHLVIFDIIETRPIVDTGQGI